MNKKLLQMMVYFKRLSKNSISNDKILMMCFYSDFTFYRDFGKSISEENYINTVDGPSIKNKEKYFNSIKEIKLSEDELFNSSEKKRLNDIYIKFVNFSNYYITYLYNNEFAALGTPFNSLIDLDKSYYMTTILNREKEIRESEYTKNIEMVR